MPQRLPAAHLLSWTCDTAGGVESTTISTLSTLHTLDFSDRAGSTKSSLISSSSLLSPSYTAALNVTWMHGIWPTLSILKVRMYRLTTYILHHRTNLFIEEKKHSGFIWAPEILPGLVTIHGPWFPHQVFWNQVPSLDNPGRYQLSWGRLLISSISDGGSGPWKLY